MNLIIISSSNKGINLLLQILIGFFYKIKIKIRFIKKITKNINRCINNNRKKNNILIILKKNNEIYTIQSNNIIYLKIDELIPIKYDIKKVINNIYIKIKKSFMTYNLNEFNSFKNIKKKTSKIVYLHFHKAAGSTVIDSLKNNYKPYKPCDPNCNPNNLNKTQINFNKFDIIDLYDFLLSKKFDFFCLEFSFFNSNLILPENLKIITILREPFNRFKSNYLHDTSKDRKESAINKGYKIDKIENFNKLNIDYKNTKINLFNKNNYYVKFLNGFNKDNEINEDNYKIAIDRLNKFHNITILENNNSHNFLKHELNISLNDKKNVNKNNDKDNLNNYNTIFKTNNIYDYKLYNFINNQVNNNNNNFIPKIIHQTWKTKNINTYAQGIIGVKSQNNWKKLYPTYKYILWTDKDINKYINKNELYKKTYNSLNEKIKKIDFFRYIILYDFGGIYSDLDFIPQKKIPEYIFNNDFIGYKASRNHQFYYNNEYANIDNDGIWVLGQAFFGCKKKHEGLKYLIENIIENKNSKISPLKHTGPEKINEIFKKNNLLDNKKTYIFSKKNIDNSKGKYGFHGRRHQW